jgi:hypothetical protein
MGLGPAHVTLTICAPQDFGMIKRKWAATTPDGSPKFSHGRSNESARNRRNEAPSVQYQT